MDSRKSPNKSQSKGLTLRKIEKQMIEAIKNGKRMNAGNTSVCVSDGVSSVLLHGNLIAELHPDTLVVSLAGWATPTTRSRIHAICIAFTKSRGIGQRKGKQYLDLPDGTEMEINARDVYTLPRVNGGFHA